MKNSILILLIILTASTFLFAQENTVCPNIEVVGPASTVKPGEVMNFSVALAKEIENLDLKYNWDLDKGKIIEGQGTSEITVSTEGLENELLKASVEIEGLPKNCRNEFAEVGSVSAVPPNCSFDEFGNLKDSDMVDRIDALLITLENDTASNGYIINYGKKKDIQKRVRLMKSHIKFRKYDETKIKFIAFEKERAIHTKLWIVPKNMDVKDIPLEK